MQRSKVELSAHLIWATHHRLPLVTDGFERPILRCVEQEAEHLRRSVLALNGMPDHVHLLVKLHSTVAVARLAQAVKGVSSRLANDEPGFQGSFDWQDHYGAFSVSRSHVRKVTRYAKRQKIHHAEGNLWGEWEETEMEWHGDVVL